MTSDPIKKGLNRSFGQKVWFTHTTNILLGWYIGQEWIIIKRCDSQVWHTPIYLYSCPSLLIKSVLYPPLKSLFLVRHYIASGALFRIHDWVSGQHQMDNFMKVHLCFYQSMHRNLCVCGCVEDCVFVRIQKNRQTLNCFTWK